MESNLLGFDFSVFHIHLVATEYNGNSRADSDKISVPVWNIFVGHAGSDIKHDDCSLALNAIVQLVVILNS